MTASYSSFCKRHGQTDDGGQTDGRNLDPLVSLHLGGLDKNKGRESGQSWAKTKK